MGHRAGVDDPFTGDYISRVRRIPRLDRETEHALAVAWLTTKDRVAAGRLLAAHLRDVVSSALALRHYGVPVSELIAEGNLGLVAALDKYDPDRGFRFLTYASHWIRAQMLEHVLRSWSLVTSGLRSKDFFRVRRERARALTRFGNSDDTAALAERLGLSEQRVLDISQRLEARDVSLDGPVQPDSETRLIDLLSDPEMNQEEDLIRVEQITRARETVEQALVPLDPRERFVIETRLLEDEDALSLAEIGRRLGVSRERARQIESRAKRKMRRRLGQLRKDQPPRLTPRRQSRACRPG